MDLLVIARSSLTCWLTDIEAQLVELVNIAKKAGQVIGIVQDARIDRQICIKRIKKFVVIATILKQKCYSGIQLESPEKRSRQNRSKCQTQSM